MRRFRVLCCPLGCHSRQGEVEAIHAGAFLAKGQQLIKLANMKGLRDCHSGVGVGCEQIRPEPESSNIRGRFFGAAVKRRVSAISQMAVQDENPGSAARFPITITVNAPENGDFKDVRLGMSVHMTIVTYRNENSFIIPHAAVEQAEDARLYITASALTRQWYGVKSRLASRQPKGLRCSGWTLDLSV